MGKFTYLNADEIVAHVEKFGTDDERDIVSKFQAALEPEDDDFKWEDCPYCESKQEKIDKAMDELEK